MENRELVIKSLAFLRELNKAYGAEKSMEIWSNLSKLVGDDELTLEVFKALMSGGQYSKTFSLIQWVDSRGVGQNSNKIQAIKMLRVWTRCGLKEAKDAVEDAEKGKKTKFEVAKEHQVDEFGNVVDIPFDRMIADFRSVGITIELE